MFSIYISENFEIDPKAHYISWALESGLGFALNQTMISLGIDFKRAIDIFALINAKSETMTMYPKANVTILPYCSVPETSQDAINKHLNDAMLAQNQYVKSDIVIFDMRNYSFDRKKGNGALLELLQCMHSKKDILGNRKNENWIVLWPGKEQLPYWAEKFLAKE